MDPELRALLDASAAVRLRRDPDKKRPSPFWLDLLISPETLADIRSWEIIETTEEFRQVIFRAMGLPAEVIRGCGA